MRSDRSTAVLTIVVGLAAVAFAIAGIWIPHRRGVPLPTSGDVLVGWTLLAAGVVTLRRVPTIAGVLLTAGVSWVAIGLAPLLGSTPAELLLRAALVPTALVAVAALLLPAGRLGGMWNLSAVTAVLVVAVLAGAGRSRFAIAGMGAIAVVAAAVRVRRLRSARAARTIAGVGAAMAAAGLVAAIPVGSAWFAANVHALMMIGACVAVIWQTMRFADLRRVASSSGAVDGGLGAALGVALATGPLDVVFPDGDHRWLDQTGNLVRRPGSGHPFHTGGTDTELVAWVSPPIELDRTTERAVGRVLAAAGDTARLRARLRERADEIADSRLRLERAAQLERARIIELIERGPLATLATARSLIADTGQAVLGTRADDADRVLRAAVDGLDPVVAAGGLAAAVEALARAHGADCVVDAADDIAPDVALGVWFTCAEALANAAKHAAGAPVHVHLRRMSDRFALVVEDRGPGGADPTGSGLSGLAQRAAAIGAILTVHAAHGTGTSVRLEGRVAPEQGHHVAGTAPAQMSDASKRRMVSQ